MRVQYNIRAAVYKTVDSLGTVVFATDGDGGPSTFETLLVLTRNRFFDPFFETVVDIRTLTMLLRAVFTMITRVMWVTLRLDGTCKLTVWGHG